LINNLHKIAQDLTETNIQKYWSGFQLVAYAIYDKNKVYLFNHPNYQTNSQNSYHVLKWSNHFIANTLILYEDYPTAIVNVELLDDYESLFSVLVHELFHGYQYLKKEARFPNEIMGIMYPLTKENVEIRNQERENLYRALMAKSGEEKEPFIHAFVSLREKRESIMKEYLRYESSIETVEGPAWYVELKAFSEKSSLPYHLVLKKYGDSLIDKYDSALHIRKSCLSSGFVMCLLLDEIFPKWQESYFNMDKSLYEIFKQHVVTKRMEVEVEDVVISDETKEIVNLVTKYKESEFNHFIEQTGYHLFIEGNITTKSIDPMNIAALENKLLHKRFIKVIINNEEFLIQQPVIAYFKDSYRDIRKLHLILNDKPIINDDSITIDGVGVIKGKIKEQEKVMSLLVE
jgi:hypothetical protein